MHHVITISMVKNIRNWIRFVLIEEQVVWFIYLFQRYCIILTLASLFDKLIICFDFFCKNTGKLVSLKNERFRVFRSKTGHKSIECYKKLIYCFFSVIINQLISGTFLVRIASYIIELYDPVILQCILVRPYKVETFHVALVLSERP